MPNVSVIIPTHNRATYLIRAVQSVLNQTCTDFEIIVIDDGSTDDTGTRIRALADSRIQLVQQSQGERAAARNTGIRHARGEYIAFLDDDDLWAPMFLERALAKFDRENVGVVYTGWSFVDARDQLLPQPPRIPEKRGVVLRDFLCNCLFPTSAGLVRRSWFELVGEFDLGLVPVEDWDLWIRVTAQGAEFNFVPEPLMLYRLHEENSTNALERVENSARRMLDKNFAALDASFDDAHREALARLDYRSAVKRFGIGQIEIASEMFARAVNAFPKLLEELSTYYQVVCAMQPDGYKGSNERLDLTLGREYIERALAASFAKDAALHSYRARAYANAYVTLARLHYGRREMAAARRYMKMAVQSNPRLATRAQTWSLWGKTIVPAPLLTQLKKWRHEEKAAPA